jgi:phosphopantetheinyl transferase (holo-ACP synthase)
MGGGATLSIRIMLGLDIVDRPEWRALSCCHLEKLWTRISKAPIPAGLSASRIGEIWGFKEAAFKAASNSGASLPVFRPRHFLVRRHPEVVVTHTGTGMVYAGRSWTSGDVIICAVISQGWRGNWGVVVQPSPEESQSSVSRLVAAALVRNVCGTASATIDTDLKGRPFVSFAGAPSPRVFVSISHDGGTAGAMVGMLR